MANQRAGVMRLVLASTNPGKLQEMRTLLASLPVQLVSTAELDFRTPIEENGSSLEENATIKARTVCAATGQWTIADDTGVFIAALGGRPGIHANRWAGPGASPEEVVAHTLREMRAVPSGQRQAYFESVVTLVAPDGQQWFFRGRIDGTMLEELRGKPRPSLLYDLIFVPDGYQQTFSEMSDQQKNAISHRGIALCQLHEFLAKMF